MNERVKNILVDKVSSDWKRFARYTCNLNDGLGGFIDQIEADYTVEGDEFKMEKFIEKLYHSCPNDYLTKIKFSLKELLREDVLIDLQKLILNDQSKDLKKFYRDTYQEAEQLLCNVRNPTRIQILDKFSELTIVDADEVESVAVNVTKRDSYSKQNRYSPIEYKEVFSKKLDLLLISGIAGIGKTWLLQKCVLDWAEGSLWQDIEFVFYLQFRRINEHTKIASIDELLSTFYNSVLKDFKMDPCFSTLFVLDGLDEFVYLNELLNHSSQSLCEYPTVKTLADVLDLQKHKCVVAGRVGAIISFKEKVKDCNMLPIQVMGFDNAGISNYIMKNTTKYQQEKVEKVFKASQIAVTMASIPFCLTAMCAIINAPSDTSDYSFNTMTELYCGIFLYFFKKYVYKSNPTFDKIMENSIYKEYILKICKISWHLLNEGKIVFPLKKMNTMIGFNVKKEEMFGFIERIKSDSGDLCQFVHLSLMEFCAAVYAHVHLTIEEITDNKRLRSCIPIVCGLTNRDKGHYVSFLTDWESLFKVEDLLLIIFKNFDEDFFMECFFEAQTIITNQLKRVIENKLWWLSIFDINSPWKVTQQKYFFEKFIDAGMKLDNLYVHKNILSENERQLFMMCSKKVHCITFYCPLMIKGWKPSDPVEQVKISVDDSYVSLIDFKDFFPWFQLCKQLLLSLHRETNFIKDICDCIRECRNIEFLEIKCDGQEFYDIGSLEISLK